MIIVVIMQFLQILNLSGPTLASSTEDQSVVYITSSGITISDSAIQKTSGDSSNTENSEFY